MLNDLQPIQIFNAATNFLSLVGLGIMTYIVWGYKQRVKQRYDDINKQLDHILLLSHEVYQTEVKDKTVAQAEQVTRRTPSTQTTR